MQEKWIKVKDSSSDPREQTPEQSKGTNSWQKEIINVLDCHFIGYYIGLSFFSLLFSYYKLCFYSISSNLSWGQVQPAVTTEIVQGTQSIVNGLWELQMPRIRVNRKGVIL